MKAGIRAPGFAAIWDPRGRTVGPCCAWAQGRGGHHAHLSGSLSVYAFDAGGAGGVHTWDGDATSGVCWGELYNIAAVQEQLAEAGLQVAATLPAVLGAGYALWRERLFARLEGLFCVVLWDHRERQLTMYRDGSGAKALYWYRGQGWAAVATRLDILMELPDVPRAIGPRGLHEYLRFLDISPPNTIYADVIALEAGLAAHFDGTELRREQPPAPAPRRRQPPPFETCVDRLDEALRASVTARLESDGSTGVFLSGGIDSALVAAVAASVRRDALDAFTVGFADHGFDEAPVAADVAEHLGIRHHRLQYSQQQYREAFEDFVAGADLPFADPAALPTLLLFRDCRRHVNAVLDGTGADTLVGVMPARHIRIATQYAAVLPRALRLTIGAAVRWLPPLAEYASILDFDAPEDLLIRWKGWSRGEIERLCGTPVSLSETRFFQIYRTFPRRDHFECYSALLGNLPDDRIHQAAELESLCVRFPYWDKTVEDLVKSLPQAYRYTDKEPKRLFRALLGRYVPRAIWDRPKHGFDFPFIAFLQQDDFSLVRRYLEPERLGRHGIVDTALVRHYARAFMDGDTSLGFRIWALVVLSGWLEHHLGIR